VAHAAGALVLVDAAQSAGHVPIDVEAMGIDLLAFTGHKGLLGPQGTGGLYVREGWRSIRVLAGGTGGDSMPGAMPAAMPDRLEAGTLNGPGSPGSWRAWSGCGSTGIERSTARDRAQAAAAGPLGRSTGVAPRLARGAGRRGDRHHHGGRDGPAELAARLDREHGVLTARGAALRARGAPAAADRRDRRGALLRRLGDHGAEVDAAAADRGGVHRSLEDDRLETTDPPRGRSVARPATHAEEIRLAWFLPARRDPIRHGQKGGRLRNLLALIGLAALLFAGWTYRDRIPGPWKQGSVAPTEVSPPPPSLPSGSSSGCAPAATPCT
jgi:hypothetical protein